MSHRTRKRGIAAERTRVANQRVGADNRKADGAKIMKTHRDEVDRLIQKYSTKK